jgi:putative MATE family efflux protein
MRAKPQAIGEERLLGTILRFALPLIATSLLQLVFNTADTMMVGRWGGATPEASAAEMAAVGSCTSLINLFVNFFLGLSVGCGICLAEDYAAGKEKGARSILHSALTFGGILGLFVALVGSLVARPILLLMGTAPSLLSSAVAYFRTYLFGMPALVIYHFSAASLRSRGDTLRPMLFLATGGVANVLFNAVAVVGLGMGAMGVGLATALSQWISLGMILAYMTKEKRISLRELGVNKESLLRVIHAGLPAGMQSILFNASALLLQSAVNSFGEITVAGNTAAMNVEGYLYTTQNALYHTVMTFVAANRARADGRRVRGAIAYSALTVALIGLSVGLAVLFLRGPILSLYAPGAKEAIRLGGIRLLAVCPFYFLCGLMEVGTGALRGLGRSILPTVTSLLGCCLFRILWIPTAFRWAQGALTSDRSLLVLYLCFPLSWLLTAAIQHVLTAKELHAARRQGVLS